jgi:autotransporter-associated beta strand protein
MRFLKFGCLLLLALGFLATGLRAQTIQFVYVGSAGIYNALVSSSNSAFEGSGLITLDISQSGMLTGKLLLGSDTYPLKARLRNESAHIKVARGPMPIVIDLSLDLATVGVSGTVSSMGSSTPFSASRSPYGKDAAAPQAGRYTVLLPPAASGTGGYGYGTMRVSRSGRVTIEGCFDSGAPFTTSAYIDGNSAFPFYARSSGPNATNISGVVQFRTLAGISDCDGLSASSQIGGGTSTAGSLIGSLYTGTGTNGLLLPFPVLSNNATLVFGQGNTALASIPVTLSSTGLSSTSTQLSALKLDLRKGTYSGSVSISGTTETFSGVVFQDQALGAGLLFSDESTGWVFLDSPSTSGSGVTTDNSATTGSGSLTKTGAGTITLSGSSTYSGGTTVSGGILQVNGSLNNGGTITLGGSTITGGGTLSLSGSSVYSGSTTINGGIIALTNPGALGTSGTISFGGGVLQYGNSNTTDYSGQIASSGSAISIDTNGQNVTFGSSLGSASTGGLTQIGTGTLTLSGSNTYTGGTLTLNGGDTFSGPTTINGGVLTLRTSGTNQPISLSGSLTLNTGAAIVLSP